MGRTLIGAVASWTDTAGWKANGIALPSPLLVFGYKTIVRRWQNNRPTDITTYPLPDVEQLNSQIPIEQWEKGRDGKPRPPYALTYIIYFASMNGALFTYANSTYGCMLCYTALEESITVTRLLRGALVWPIVQPSHCPMRTSYGEQTRPLLEIVGWRELPGGSEGLVPQQAPAAQQLAGPAPAAASPATSPAAQTGHDDPPWETTTAPASPPMGSPPTASAPKLAPAYPRPALSAAAAAAVSAAAKAPILAGAKPVKPITTAEAIADELPAHSAPPKKDDGWR
jgi:hypothetical protein